MRKLLALLLITLSLPIAFAYTDTASYPWKQSIEYLTQRGFVQGYEDETYRPLAKINRAEFAKIVIAARFEPADYQGFTAGCFPDVPANQWYTPYICFAKSKGIVKGHPDGFFRPADRVNQAEALKILLLTFEQPLVPATEPWYKQYLDSARTIGMLYFAGGNEAAYKITRGEMAYFTAWLLSHREGKSVDQLMSIPPYVDPIQYRVEGTSHIVVMDTAQVTLRVMTGHDSIRPKECDFPHHCVAEARAESFDSFIARSHKGLVVSGAFFDAYSKPLNGTNYHQIASDIVIDGDMKSMYGWDASFGDGGMLAQLQTGTFRIFYPVRDWLKAEVRAGLSNYPLVLRHGAVRTAEQIGQHDPNDAGFWQSARRGGFGLSQDGSRLYYVSAQGTVADLGAALKGAGAWDGFALDSGASNALYLEGKTLFKPGRNLTTVVEVFAED